MIFQFFNDRPAPEVESQFSVELHHWRILVRGNGDLHLTAQMKSGSLRVTSKLHCIEVSRGIVRTESGRSYQLCAPPEEDKQLRTLMELNALRNLLMISGDASQAVWDAVNAGAWPAEHAELLPAPH
ncbi:MAG: hypothetical protein Q8S02_18050 [Hydrogenophaga sp.]|nr:hypothetical protein [Hydrogenophaga sp.]